MQKKKIIFLTKYYHPHVGGVEKHVEKITQKLIDRQFRVIIITEQFDKKLNTVERTGKAIIYRIPVPTSEFFKKFYIWIWFFRNFRLLKDSKIIHIHDVFYWILPFRFFLRSQKVFTTFHGYEGFPFQLKWKILRKIYESLSNGNICVGDFMKKWYGTSPNFVIYGACESPKNKISNPSLNSIVFFGRLDAQTNILEYIKGFKIFLKKESKWNLSIFGDGILREKMQKKITINKFEAKISDEIPKYEYVFVSRYLSMLEAMVAKRLVFAYYDNEIKRDYLLDSPFKNYVVAVNSPKMLADKLEYYSKNEAEKSKLVKRGYEFAKKQSWDKITGIYLKLWNFTR